MREYTYIKITKAEDMYKVYEVARQLNKNMTFEEYKQTMDYQTKVSNYTQHVAQCGDKPASLISTQDKCNMSLAPKPECSFSNVATLPEHQGSTVSCFLMETVKKIKADEGYAGIVICSRQSNERATAFYKKSGFNNDESYAWRLRIESEKDGKIRAKL